MKLLKDTDVILKEKEYAKINSILNKDNTPIIPNEVAVVTGRKNYQFTKTWFKDKHIEATVIFEDGAFFIFDVEFMDHIPACGDPKHYEWLWENNQWVLIVDENY